MEKMLVLSNFFFCHYVFKRPSAAEASESAYVRERVKTREYSSLDTHDDGDSITTNASVSG